jgi:NADP-dependent aldehyde dehydrogenase
MITQNIIGFQLSELSNGHIYAVDAKSSTNLPETFSVATVSETNLAAEKAYLARRAYRNASGSSRAAFLREIARGIEALGDTLVARIMKETAYPEARIIVERTRTCNQLRMFADIAEDGRWRDITIDLALPDRTPAPRPDIRKMMIPLGPVVVFGASNFPLAYSTAGGDVASAFASGCPVIVKAHGSHLGTNALVAEVIMHAAHKTGMPDGVFSSLNGDGFETGKQLLMHPYTTAVGFTGSLAGGRALFDLGQQRDKPIPVFAEMGSVNPVFILSGKMQNQGAQVASQLLASMSMTAGQFCTKPGIWVAVESESTLSFLNQLKISISDVEKATMLSKDIYNRFQKGVHNVVDQSGIQMLYNASSDEGDLVTPEIATVAARDFLTKTHLHSEIFGPFAIVVLCSTFDEMKAVAEDLEGQLTTSIFADDQDKMNAQSLVEILQEKAGRIIFNGVPTGVEVCAAMTHGGPYPASTDSRFTAVGHHAIRRWIRPVTFQNFPDYVLPETLKG